MLIAIASDHAGFNLKEVVKSIVIELGHECEDFGCSDTNSVDYPDFAFVVADAVAQGKADCGILICGSGIGMSIVANKVSGIRAALCHDVFSARRARQHNDANILCLGGETVKETASEIIDAFLTSEFERGRHLRRINKIRAMEG